MVIFPIIVVAYFAQLCKGHKKHATLKLLRHSLQLNLAQNLLVPPVIQPQYILKLSGYVIIGQMKLAAAGNATANLK